MDYYLILCLFFLVVCLPVAECFDCGYSDYYAGYRCACYNQLSFIQCSHRGLYHLPNFTAEQMHKTRYLYLINNNLGSITPEEMVPADWPRLEVLYLDGNAHIHCVGLEWMEQEAWVTVTDQCGPQDDVTEEETEELYEIEELPALIAELEHLGVDIEDESLMNVTNDRLLLEEMLMSQNTFIALVTTTTVSVTVLVVVFLVIGYHYYFKRKQASDNESNVPKSEINSVEKTVPAVTTVKSPTNIRRRSQTWTDNILDPQPQKVSTDAQPSASPAKMKRQSVAWTDNILDPRPSTMHRSDAEASPGKARWKLLAEHILHPRLQRDSE